MTAPEKALRQSRRALPVNLAALGAVGDAMNVAWLRRKSRRGD